MVCAAEAECWPHGADESEQPCRGAAGCAAAFVARTAAPHELGSGTAAELGCDPAGVAKREAVDVQACGWCPSDMFQLLDLELEAGTARATRQQGLEYAPHARNAGADWHDTTQNIG